MSHTTHPESQALCPSCEIGPFTRNHYFTGKLLLERDFSDEARFNIDKLRHHHQRLHGWGVVCGLKVTQHQNPACRDRFLCIQPGTAIDCCGHEILVATEDCVDITQLAAIKALKKKDDTALHTLQVCLRYRECPTEEIPVLYDECGCDDTRCAPNRILESYDVDVTLDPPGAPDGIHLPEINWRNTVPLAHASRALLHEGTRRLYVMTQSPDTLYQVSTDTHAIEASSSLPGKGLALAASNDGSRVYVVTKASGDPNAKLSVLDASSTASPPLKPVNPPLELTGSGTGDVCLAVLPAPDNRVLTLLAKGQPDQVIIWGTDLETAASPTKATIPSLGRELRGLVVGSDGKQAYVLDPTAAPPQAQVVDIATQAFKAAAAVPLPAGTAPHALAIVRSTGPDLLAVVDKNNKKLYLISLNPVNVLPPVALDHNPVAAVASPGGQWAYVLEIEGATAESYAQTVNLHRLQQGLSPAAGTPVRLGDSSQEILLTSSGRHLYVPYLGVTTNPSDGGVAILDVTEHACEEILWRHLDGCPHCDTANCVVIATIENYRVGFTLQDPADPPTKPSDDITNQIARIDNRKGRHLLPSTQVLGEMVECLLDQGPGGAGVQGPPGPPGPPKPPSRRSPPRDCSG